MDTIIRICTDCDGCGDTRLLACSLLEEDDGDAAAGTDTGSGATDTTTSIFGGYFCPTDPNIEDRMYTGPSLSYGGYISVEFFARDVELPTEQYATTHKKRKIYYPIYIAQHFGNTPHSRVTGIRSSHLYGQYVRDCARHCLAQCHQGRLPTQCTLVFGYTIGKQCDYIIYMDHQHLSTHQ
jgi:hypothetical protein